MTKAEFTDIRKQYEAVHEAFWKINAVNRSVESFAQMKDLLTAGPQTIRIELFGRNGQQYCFNIARNDFLFEHFAKHLIAYVTGAEETAKKRWEEL